MACNLSAAIPLGCIDAIGGVKTAYFGVDIVISSVNYDANNQIIGMTGASGTFYQYELPKNTANAVETFNISNENGTAFYEQAFTFNLQKLSADKRNQLLLLSQNRDIKIIFEDNNGLFWLIGKDRGGVVSAGSSNTGTAPGDASNYVLTVTAQEPDMMYQISSLSVINGITITLA